ncbi:MAG: YraN family protein [Spirochaetales bacterium]|nr:YraN family protein [Leptospiraceae bacterium]MCP5483789.1 YraN family protein [Spirochaetales bacterium]
MIWSRRSEIRYGREDRVFRHPGEKLAAGHLEANGHTLICHNYHCGAGEIDLVTRDPQGRIHFCEVKAWRPGPVHPLESLSRRRRARMVATARIFLEDLENRETGEQADISFDLLWVQPASGAVEHFEAIFSSDDDA